MGLNAKLIDCVVTHERFVPKRYRFRSSFFWFSVDIDNIDNDFTKIPILSRNRFNLLSFYDKDHISFGFPDIRQNVEHFLQQNSVLEKPKKIELWTHLRFFNYVFNPVSFYLITMPDDSLCAIIEVGNTFNELKPYFVSKDHFENGRVEFMAPKQFYVSPFISVDTIFTFRLNCQGENISIGVLSDAQGGETILAAGLKGRFKELTSKNLLKRIIRFPFMTLQIIAQIHWHALVLWLKRIPYFSKNENFELQKGTMIWKKR